MSNKLLRATFPKVSRNYTLLNEIQTQYSGAIPADADPSDYRADVAVKAVRIG